MRTKFDSSPHRSLVSTTRPVTDGHHWSGTSLQFYIKHHNAFNLSCHLYNDEANDYWEGYTIRFTSGDNEGEIREVTGYLLLNGEITVSEAFTIAPGAGDTFILARITPTVRGILHITQGAPE